MYKIAICDDDCHYLEVVTEQVRRYCKENGIEVTVKTYNDSDMLVEDIEGKKLFDAYILDIEMKKYTGIEVARSIEKNTNSAIVIFLTAYRDYAIEGYGLNVMRYVLKERAEEELFPTLEEMFQRLQRMSGSDSYIIKNQRKFIKLLDKEIIYIYKHEKNTVFVLTGKREEKDRHTLQQVYRKIKENKAFFFLDRSFILNVQHIRKINIDHVSMTDGYSIETSKVHVSELRNYIHSYWGDMI